MIEAATDETTFIYMAASGFDDVDVHLTTRSSFKNGLVSFGIVTSAPSSVGETQASTPGAPLVFAKSSKIFQMSLAASSVLTRVHFAHGLVPEHSSN